MVRIIAIDKEGKTIGKSKLVTQAEWEWLQRFGKILRWKEVKEVKSTIKKEKNERKKRSGTGNAVESAGKESK